jgi:hypothetical protein
LELLRLPTIISTCRVFRILPGTSLSGPKSSEDLLVCGVHRPFLRRYWVKDGRRNSAWQIASGEFLKNQLASPQNSRTLREFKQLKFSKSDAFFSQSLGDCLQVAPEIKTSQT